MKIKGYRIVFSTHLSDEEIEDCIDGFLREVDARQAIAHVEQMKQEELMGIFKI